MARRHCLWFLALAMTLVTGVNNSSLLVDITNMTTVHQLRPILLIAFKSWDRYCVSSVAAFETTTSALASIHPNLTFGKWDMDLYPKALSSSGLLLRGFPAYVLFNDTVAPRKYIGPPTHKAMESWLTNSSTPLITLESPTEWEVYVASAHELVALMIVPDFDSPDRFVAEALAAQNDVGLVALRVYDSTVDDADAQLWSQFWVFDPLLNKHTQYTGLWTMTSLAAFLINYQRPWLGMFDPSWPLNESVSAYGLVFSDPHDIATHTALLNMAEKVLIDMEIRNIYDVRFLLVVPPMSSELASYFELEGVPAIVWYKDPTTYSVFPIQGSGLDELATKLILDKDTGLTQHLVVFLKLLMDIEASNNDHTLEYHDGGASIINLTSLAQLNEFVTSTPNTTTLAFVALYSQRCPSCSAFLPRLREFSVRVQPPTAAVVLVAAMNVDLVQYQDLVEVVGGTRFSLPAVFICRNGSVYDRIGTDSTPPSTNDLLVSVDDAFASQDDSATFIIVADEL